MAEYIEREALRTEMYRQAFEEDSPLQRWDSGCWIRYKMFENAIDSAPAADVVPVRHGRWVDGKGELVPWDEMNENCPRNSAYCSVCGEWLTASDEYPVIGNYCPNCGALMDKDGDGDGTIN